MANITKVKVRRRKEIINEGDLDFEEELEFDLEDKDAALILMLDNIRKEIRRLK